MLSCTFLPMFTGNRKKQVGDVRVKLSATVFDNFGNGLVKGECLAVRAIGRHGIQRVNNSKDTGSNWNLFPLELFRVAGAVKTLMVAEDDLCRCLQKVYF